MKSKLSFEEYTPSTQNDVKTEEHIDVKTEKPRKVKRTFYILESIAKQLDAMYAQRLVREDKIDKSDIVAQALLEFMKQENPDVKAF